MIAVKVGSGTTQGRVTGSADGRMRLPRSVVAIGWCAALLGGCGWSLGMSESDARDRVLAAVREERPDLVWGVSCLESGADSPDDYRCDATFAVPAGFGGAQSYELALTIEDVVDVPDVGVQVTFGVVEGANIWRAVPRCPGFAYVPDWWENGSSPQAARRADAARCVLMAWPDARNSVGGPYGHPHTAVAS